jgi:hypothetical protein
MKKYPSRASLSDVLKPVALTGKLREEVEELTGTSTSTVTERLSVPTWLEMYDLGGQTVRAMTYVAEGNESDGCPSLRYITLLRDGARAHGLPVNGSRCWRALSTSNDVLSDREATRDERV